jgi:hypothetical protein
MAGCIRRPIRVQRPVLPFEIGLVPEASSVDSPICKILCALAVAEPVFPLTVVPAAHEPEHVPAHRPQQNNAAIKQGSLIFSMLNVHAQSAPIQSCV